MKSTALSLLAAITCGSAMFGCSAGPVGGAESTASSSDEILGGWPLTQDQSYYLEGFDSWGVADYDHDGKDDLWVKRYSAPTAFNGYSCIGEDATGKLHSSGTVWTGQSIDGWPMNALRQTATSPGDLDRDGNPNLAISDASGATTPGLGIFTLDNGVLHKNWSAPYGRSFGGWILGSGDLNPRIRGDFDGDGAADLFLKNNTGVGVLGFGYGGAPYFALAAHLVASSPYGSVTKNGVNLELGTRFDWGVKLTSKTGPAGVLAASNSGIGVLTASAGKLQWLTATPYGSWIANAWHLSQGDLAPAVGDVDGDGTDEIMLASGWGFAVVKWDVPSQQFVMMAIQPWGAAVDGTVVNNPSTRQYDDLRNEVFMGDFNGDGRKDILIRDPIAQRLTILTFDAAVANVSWPWWAMHAMNPQAFPSFHVLATLPFVTRTNGGWYYNGTDKLAAVGRFHVGDRDSILVDSGWGVGILGLDNASAFNTTSAAPWDPTPVCGAAGQACCPPSSTCTSANNSCVGGTCVCTPTKTSCNAGECGAYQNGCGGTVTCGGCAAGQTCTSGKCCQPAKCQAGQCGSSRPDTCGGSLNCGSCPTGQTCNAAGTCQTSCTKLTCGANSCGSRSDNCGGTLNCGACGAHYTCTSSNTCSCGYNGQLACLKYLGNQYVLSDYYCNSGGGTAYLAGDNQMWCSTAL